MATILVVDDDESLALLLAYTFRKAGHSPTVAPSGHAALLAARAHLDVILLDLDLPDISGEEVLRRLKRDPATAPIPVVVLSGAPDAADRVPRDRVNGALAVLQKPVGGSELCAVVDLVLEGRESETADAHRTTVTGSGPLLHQQRDLLFRMMSTGSVPLVRQIFRRLVADRSPRHQPAAALAPSWRDLARAGQQEGVLTDGEGSLLTAGPAVVAASPCAVPCPSPA